MKQLAWDQVVARRLERSSLAGRRAPLERLFDVVSEICGVHAQLPTGAELALSARVEGVTRDVVRDALWQERALIKAASIRTTPASRRRRRRTQRGRRVEILVEPFRALTRAQLSVLEGEAERVAVTYGAEPVLELL